jgi:hypothetical protein
VAAFVDALSPQVSLAVIQDALDLASGTQYIGFITHVDLLLPSGSIPPYVPERMEEEVAVDEDPEGTPGGGVGHAPPPTGRLGWGGMGLSKNCPPKGRNPTLSPVQPGRRPGGVASLPDFPVAPSLRAGPT